MAVMYGTLPFCGHTATLTAPAEPSGSMLLVKNSSTTVGPCTSTGIWPQRQLGGGSSGRTVREGSTILWNPDSEEASTTTPATGVVPVLDSVARMRNSGPMPWTSAWRRMDVPPV